QRWLAAAVFLAAVCFATAAAALPRRRRPWLAVATAAVAIVLLGVTIHDLAAAVDQSWFRVKVADLLAQASLPLLAAAMMLGAAVLAGWRRGAGWLAAAGGVLLAVPVLSAVRDTNPVYMEPFFASVDGTVDDAVQALAGPDLLGRRDPAHVLGDQLELGGVVDPAVPDLDEPGRVRQQYLELVAGLAFVGHDRPPEPGLPRRRAYRPAGGVQQPGPCLVRQERPPVVAERQLLPEREPVHRRVPAAAPPPPPAQQRQQAEQRR